MYIYVGSLQNTKVKQFSLFKIGLVLTIISIVWIGFVFSEEKKTLQSFSLNGAQTSTMNIELQKSGIGFYKTTMPNFARDALFVQVIDPNEDIIADKKIETKMAVNYFDFKYSGIYTLKITNLSDKSIIVEVETGDTNASEMRNAGIILFIGVLLIMISAYRWLKNYRTTQPEEKIS